jgi:hypothetical protein
VTGVRVVAPITKDELVRRVAAALMDTEADVIDADDYDTREEAVAAATGLAAYLIDEALDPARWAS